MHKTTEEEADLATKKYARFGRIDQGRFCDKIAKGLTKILPGNSMPPRWKQVPPAQFVQKYGDGPMWSLTNNYSVFILNGHTVFRVWTNTNTDWLWVDVVDILEPILSTNGFVEDIPAGSLKKCKPLTKRWKLTSTNQASFLVNVVRQIYGLESP